MKYAKDFGNISAAEVFNQYTGICGLHEFIQKERSTYHDYVQAKEIALESKLQIK